MLLHWTPLMDDKKPECKIDAYGNKRWFLNGKYHRENGPAVEWANGNKFWCLNGLLHRENGPAIEYSNGYKAWYLNGKLHRENGPAIEYANGETRYYINGNHIPQLDNMKIYGKENLQKLITLL